MKAVGALAAWVRGLEGWGHVVRGQGRHSGRANSHAYQTHHTDPVTRQTCARGPDVKGFFAAPLQRVRFVASPKGVSYCRLYDRQPLRGCQLFHPLLKKKLSRRLNSSWPCRKMPKGLETQISCQKCAQANPLTPLKRMSRSLTF
jgi:hypothetical protein